MTMKTCPSCGGCGKVKEWTYSDWFMADCSWCGSSGSVRAEPLYQEQCGTCHKSCAGCYIYRGARFRRNPNVCKAPALKNAGRGKIRIED